MAVPSGNIPDPSTEWMHSTFAFLHLHDVVLILIIIVLFAALGGGPVLKSLLKWVGTLLHGTTETNIVIGERNVPNEHPTAKEGECCGLLVDPAKCIMHQAEHERSLENKRQILAMWTHIEALGAEMRAGFKEVRTTVIEGQAAILKALGQKPPWLSKAQEYHGE